MEYTFMLCAGRHDAPVMGLAGSIAKNVPALFQEVSNPLDFAGMYNYAREHIPADCDDLRIVATGLTPAMLAVVEVCTERNIALRVYHYTREERHGIPLYDVQHVLGWELCSMCGEWIRTNEYRCPHCGS